MRNDSLESIMQLEPDLVRLYTYCPRCGEIHPKKYMANRHQELKDITCRVCGHVGMRTTKD